MPRPHANPSAETVAAKDAHDVTENSLHARLEARWERASPYLANRGAPAELAGYPADPEFQLRGHFENLMLDAANPLFGLVIRLRTLDDLPNIEYLHQTLQTQVSVIREEMQQHGYAAAHLEVYSYALCLYLDEAVMSRPWGCNSYWSHEPLLSVFHHETHGGEKIFVLLERMLQSPAEFQDVLEFLYFCLCLGLKGKYALDPKGDELVNALISRMHKVLRDLRGPSPERVCDPYTNVVYRPCRRRRWTWPRPWWSPLVVSVVAMVCAYCYYSYRLGLITGEVLESLDSIILQP
ncbi:type IVB secretion system protein IcmH/DotU [Pseudomonas anuradhapurensis]